MLKTLVGWTTILILIVLSGWYFLIKKYDYSISFKINEVPGEVYQQLLYYEYEHLRKTKEQETIPFNRISQKVSLQGEELQLNWQFLKEQDSLTRVVAEVKHLDNSFFTRWKILFGQEDLQEILKEEIKRFQKELNEEAQFYQVQIIGETVSPATTCACIALENQVRFKARDMMKTINLLSSYIRYNDIETIARPRVNVKNWDLNANNIKYEFCFPISSEVTPKEMGNIYIKNLPAESAIKAVFNGNYMYSHLAWVKILDYAEVNNIEVRNEPLEIFNDNPEMGGDATKWEAEIYFPLK